MVRNTREEIEAALKDLCDGLSPFQKMDSFEDFVKMHTDVYDTFGDGSFDILLDILLFPPRLGRIDAEDFKYVLADALAAIGKRNTRYALDKIRTLIDIKRIRPVLINAIGGLGSKDGLPILEPLLQLDGLSENDLMELACAFGDIGGKKAIESLETMKRNFGDHSPDLLKAIENELERR
ncbi:HEAT repeat domain-containing protein [Saccharibacillus sacchari]|uniref:HEAT repeat domain-containing protein n=1 Tax=Saccharibacillus sacchari TaxID=456493 RepID=A0ACC6PA55_9BACL